MLLMLALMPYKIHALLFTFLNKKLLISAIKFNFFEKISKLSVQHLKTKYSSLQMAQPSTPSKSEEINEPEKKVRMAPTLADDQQPIDVTSVMSEINKLKNKIEELQIRNVGTNDPEFIEKSKKLVEIRKYLTKKTKPSTPSKFNLWTKIKQLRKRQGKDHSMDIEPTPSELFEVETINGGSSNFSNYSVDDAFLFGAECVLSLLEIIKAPK